MKIQSALLLLVALVSGVNIGGDGSSEREAYMHYLIGNSETYPNLKLSLWNEEVRFNKTYLGEVRLHGELALRVDDWIDYDEEGNRVDNHLVEMGWLFTSSTSGSGAKYDGFKTQFLFNSTQINSPDLAAYSRNFEIIDLYTGRLTSKTTQVPADLTVDDKNSTDWEIVPHKSRKVCD